MTLAELLANPLTATLCLVIARDQPDALRSRAALFTAVVERFVGDWLDARGAPDIDMHALLRGLETLALEAARSLRTGVTETEIRRVFGRGFPYKASLSLSAAEAHLGVLLPSQHGKYDFAFHAVQEHLAARALLRDSASAILGAAREQWAREIAPHAVSLSAQDDPERGHALLKSLLPDGKLSSFGQLRSLLVSIRAASDLASLPDDIANTITDQSYSLLRDETSLWVGERVADAISGWVRTQPQRVGRLARRALINILDKRSSLAAWYMGRSDATPEWWKSQLLHRDAAVRATAAEKLSQWVDRKDVRDMLCIGLQDHGFGGGHRPVALQAGLSLRSAKRGRGFLSIREFLLRSLRKGSQFEKAGAALALLPDEAPVDLLAAGVAGALHGSGLGVPQSVLDALASTEGGHAALDRWSRDWRTPRPRPVPAEPTTEGTAPPASWEVRRRLLRSIAPLLPFLKRAHVERVTQVDHFASFDLACEMASDFPGPIVAMLDAAPAKPILAYDDEPQLALGRAAVRHPGVAGALVRLWRRASEDHTPGASAWEKADYPGRALEELVRRGDRAATEIYVDWLRHAHLAIMFRPPDDALLPGFTPYGELRTVGHERALEVVGQATDGWLDDGKRVYLHVGVAGAALHRLSVFLRHDEELRARLERWIAEGDLEHFDAALWALQDVGLSAPTRAMLATRLEQHFSEPHAFGELAAWRLLHLIDRGGWAGDVQSVLSSLSDPECQVMLVAAAVWLPHLPRSAQQRLSTRVTAHGALIEAVSPHLAKRLVDAAPEAWTTLLCSMASTLGSSGGVLWMPFFSALSVENRRLVARTWSQFAFDLPWVAAEHSAFRCVRPGDLVGELLFDLDMENVGAPEPEPSKSSSGKAGPAAKRRKQGPPPVT